MNTIISLIKRCSNYTIELPLFIFTFVFLNPFIISAFKNEGLSSLEYFICVKNVISCDFYFSLFFSFTIAIVISVIKSGKIRYTTKTLWYFILLFLFVVRKFLLNEFDLDFSPSVISMIAETNAVESSGFVEMFVVSNIGLKYLLLFVVCFSLVIISEVIYCYFKVLKNVSRFLFVGCLFLLPFGFISFKCFNDLTNYSGQNTIIGLYSAYNSYKKNQNDRKTFFLGIEKVSALSNVANCSEDNCNVVFVMGESFIKSHSSIYGYQLPTNPFFEKEREEGRLLVFSDVITSYNHTTPSLQNTFCLNDLSKDEKWFNGIYWPQLFKKAGYNVYFWDNQKGGDKHFQGSFFEMYSNKVISECYTETNEKSSELDMFIIDDFISRKINISQGLNFVYFHLQGQHFPFANKCPDNYKKFLESDILIRKSYLTNDMRKEISDYDNSIYYTGIVVQKIIEYFNRTNSIVVFTSDHGEEVYDYRDKAGRSAINANYKSEYLHYQHDVPFIIWFSESYAKKHSELIKKIKEISTLPYSLDRCGNMLLTIGGITSNYYRADDDILNPSFTTKKRKIFLRDNSQTIDYDLEK